jgi:hypothetical protein
MIGFFPILYNEEPLYGGISRLAKYLGYSVSYKELNRVLFGKYNMKASIDLPNNLNHFEQIISKVSNYTADYLLDNHTQLKYYSYFIGQNKRSQVVSSMLGSSLNNIHTRIGINASRAERHKFPRFCPLCLIEFKEVKGEAHWTLLHQIPGNNACNIHKCLLQEYVPETFEFNSSLYINADQAIKRHQSINFEINPLQLRLTSIFDSILNGTYNFSIDEVNYKEMIDCSRYKQGSKFNTSKLTSDFIEFYGESNLRKVIPFKKNSLTWIPDIIKRPNHYFDPIRHILINEFVHSIKPESRITLTPFGKGPWFCYNKTCKKYLTKCLAVHDYHIDLKSKRLIGTFRCDCGMIYTKSFIKNSRGISKEFTRIKVRGELWMERLQQELLQKKSYREIGRILGTDAKTIKILSDQKSFNQSVPQSLGNALKKKQAEWKNLLTKSEVPKIINARNCNPKLYTWLYRNAKPWLLEINSQSKFQSIFQLKIDWNERDQNLASRLKQTHGDLLKEDFRGMISKSFLTKSLGKGTTIEKNLNKLPLTKQLLLDFSETQNSYHLRKTKIVVKEMVKGRKPVKYWNVVRAAGIRFESSKLIRSQIEEIIQKSVSEL